MARRVDIRARVRRERIVSRITLGVATVALAAVAHANGRPPETNGVILAPSDAHSIYVRSTFGLLVSHDDGCSFRWTCEQNIGYGGTFDPNYAIAQDGTLFATTFTGLRVSHDGGCSFTTATSELPAGAPGRIADTWVDGIDIGPTGEIWVTTADSGKPNDVFRSTDGGVTFRSRGMLSSTARWKSVGVAPSDPLRVYVSGYQAAPASDASTSPTAHLFSTTDGGQIWTELSLAGVQLGDEPVVKVAAIDGTDPQHVFLVSVHSNPPAGDRLYHSTNGGASFTQVLATTVGISNVVIRDAMTVLVAGGPGDSFRSDDGGATFSALAGAPLLQGLAKRADGTLVGAGANWDPDFMAVASSPDATQWHKLFRFIELDGPLSCAPGTASHEACDPLWDGIREQFGATGPMCSSATDLPPLESPADTVSPKSPGGCCSTSELPDDAPPIGGAVLALLVASIIGSRRRRSVP